MRSKLTVFLPEAPTIKIDGNDDVHVRDESTEVVVDRVMSIHSLLVYVRRGQRVLDEWRSRHGPIEGDGDGH
jgi:predicted methyltransferase